MMTLIINEKKMKLWAHIKDLLNYMSIFMNLNESSTMNSHCRDQKFLENAENLICSLGRMVIVAIHSHVEIEERPRCGVMMKSCIDLRCKIRLRDHRWIQHIVKAVKIFMGVGRKRQTRWIPSPKRAAAAAAAPHQARKRSRVLLKVSLHLETLIAIAIPRPRLMMVMIVGRSILLQLPTLQLAGVGEVVGGEHDALRDLQRRQPVDLVLCGVEQPVHHFAGLAEAEPLLKVVQLYGGGDGEADAPVPQSSYRAHFAVPVFASQGSRHSDYPRVFQPGP